MPLSWGATFDPALVREMAGRASAPTCASVGVHQGLAPVLDVVRDVRWGRVEETIGEDPYLVGTIATAYIQGLESAGIVATLKHFVGYSASRAGRNLAPVSMGPREFADVLLPPFEMAVREGGARSVMHSYTDLDGVPSAGDPTLLTELLRDTWGFDGHRRRRLLRVGFLHTLHGWPPTGRMRPVRHSRPASTSSCRRCKAYGAPLRDAVVDGRVDEAFVDRALRRVLRQKLELGLLDRGLGSDPRGDPRGGPGRHDVATRPDRSGLDREPRRSPARSPSGRSSC